jgi:hypothetical protein
VDYDLEDEDEDDGKEKEEDETLVMNDQKFEEKEQDEKVDYDDEEEDVNSITTPTLSPQQEACKDDNIPLNQASQTSSIMPTQMLSQESTLFVGTTYHPLDDPPLDSSNTVACVVAATAGCDSPMLDTPPFSQSQESEVPTVLATQNGTQEWMTPE